MDTDSPVLPMIASKDPHNLEEAARIALGECCLWLLLHFDSILARAQSLLKPLQVLSGVDSSLLTFSCR